VGERVAQIRDIEHFHWRLSESECPVSFVSNGGGISLAAAMELASIVTNQKSKPDDGFRSVRVARNAIWGLIKESRWPQRAVRASLRDGDTALVVLPSNHDDPAWTQQTRSLLNELGTNGFSTQLSRALTGAVIEMVDNVWLHSETQHTGLLAYQIRRRKFAFSVLDTGIGMLNSLRKNPKFQYLTSSMDAAGRAIEPGVSRFDNSGGMGYPSLFHALASLWGTARIRTGEAALVIDHTGETRSKERVYLPHLPGVHISVRCALDPPSHSRS
jgi:anti-sigma regulatory factor (Ser/Thr protein kinase)